MIQEWLMVGIKLKISACVEGDIEKAKGAMRILLLILL
jgi:hypothetical protein